MIKKLKRRYLITNMILLSATLLIALGILFAVLYRSQVESSYVMMNELLDGSELPEPPPHREEAEPQSDAVENGVIVPLSATVTTDSVSPTRREDPPPYWQFDDSDSDDWSFQPGDPWGNPWWNPWEDPRHDPKKNEDSDDLDDDENSYDERRDRDDEEMPPPPGEWQGNVPPEFSRTGSQPAETRQTQTTAMTQDSRFDQSRRSDPPPGQPGESSQTTAPTEAPVTSASGTQTTRTTTVTASATTAATTTGTTAVQGVVSSKDETTTEPAVKGGEGHYVPDAFVARVDKDGNIESYAGNSHKPPKEGESEFSQVHHAMDKIRGKGEGSGTIEIGETPYRYLYKKDQSGSYHLVLMDRTLEVSTLTKMLVIFVLLALVGLACMLGLSSLLANWTVTPIATAWEKQKQFVADASHELKTPLAVISANTEVILANPADHVADQGKWLSYIQSETMRMSKLITNLLTVARMDSDSARLQSTEPLKFSETVANVCLQFEPVIFEHGKTLNTVIQRNVMLRAEEDNVRQLLSILLDNAVLHSVPKAQITVSLSKDTQGMVRLAVANTAKDIPAEQLAHLFDRFFRVDTEGSPNGSGLGLSIAKSIVHQMGGTLTVTSENQLVTFVATFPH